MRNMVVFVLMFICCIIVGESKGEGYDPPPHCAVVDCPIYSVIQSGKEFEIRNYSEAIWMSSPTIREYSIIGGFGEGGNNLTYYFYRDNDKHVVIEDKGEPVAMMDILGNSSYTVYFYFPYKYQNGSVVIPKPLVPELKQVKLPKYKYAAARRSYGEITEDLVAEQIDKLMRNLQGTPYQRTVDRHQYTSILYYGFSSGYEILIWFD